MNPNEVSISVWSEKSANMLQKVKRVLDKLGLDGIDLPENVYDLEKPITMVFVGQYSAGKSTIIKALTGIDEIETGEGIKTMVTQSYDWTGIEVVDTPGIHTRLRPDHDEISYKAIARADLLVYVVTEDLFDSFIGENFRKLLLEQNKADEMILVVNKMADIGNTPENQRIKLNDLRKVTEPYSPEDLRVVFIDAQSYIDSLTEEDEEIAEEYRERSNYEQLVKTLNQFVEEKGLSSRLTTVLYRLFEILQEAIPHFQASTGDDDVDGIEEHLLRERHIISQEAWRLESAIRALYENTASEIRETGRSVANEIFNCENEDAAEDMLEKAYASVDEVSTTCEQSIIAKIEEMGEECNARLDDFYNSDFSNALRIQLNKRKDSKNIIIDQFLKSDWITKGSGKLISNTTGTNAAANGLKAFSGSNAHKWVINIGHYFGHNFKPWEAVKWVKGINIAGKALGIFGVVFSWGMRAKDDYEEDKRHREIRSTRERIRASFNDAANNLVNHYKKIMSEFMEENYNSKINDIDKKIMEIRALRVQKSEAIKLLEDVQAECKQLIVEIHENH